MHHRNQFEYCVEEIISVTADVSIIFLRPQNDQEKISYSAGQYIEIAYPDQSYQAFSIANAPPPTGEIELHVRHLPENKEVAAFIDHLKTAQTMHFRGPFGKEIYRDNSKPTLLLAAGTGFAQAKAIIEQAAIMHHYPLIHLFWGVKHEQDFYLPQLAQQWRETIPHFHFTPVISQIEKNPSWTGKTGYTYQIAIETYPNLTDFQVYVSGPRPMAVAARDLLQKHHLSTSCLYSDML